MPKIVVHAIVRETINTPPAAKTGRQRAASHNNTGNNSAPGTTVSQSCCGSESTTPVIAASADRPAVPSNCSLRGGGSRRAADNPITIGATVTTPTATPVHQCSQVVRICASGPRNNRDAIAPPNDDGTVPAIVAPSRPKTLRN